MGVGLLFSALSPLAAALTATLASGSASAASALALGLALTLPSDALAAVLDDVLVLSLLVLSKWQRDYFQVRGTTSSVSPRNSERYFLPSLLMK